MKATAAHRWRTELPNTARRFLVCAATAVVALVAASCGTPPPAVPAPAGEFVRPMVFPVFADVSYSDSFGAPRSGGRSHEGQDVMSIKLAPLLAAADGEVTYLRHSNSGLSGNAMIITDADGWEYVYIHMNNDSLFTDDGKNDYDLAFADGIKKGQKVKAGEFIGFIGDSGNAEGTSPHVHFELRSPDDVAVNAFWSLMSAERRVHLASDEERPFGVIDAAGRDPVDQSVIMTGWALQPVGDEETPITVYVDHNPVAFDVERAERVDVNAAKARTGDHGIRLTGIEATPEQEICVILHNLEGGSHARIQCRMVA
jgi:hypothetical protein